MATEPSPRPAPARVPTRSRFADPAMRFLAPWCRVLWPVPPSVVGAMRPSEVAAVLGLDRQAVIQIVAPEDAPFVQPPVTGPRRLRLAGGDDA